MISDGSTPSSHLQLIPSEYHRRKNIESFTHNLISFSSITHFPTWYTLYARTRELREWSIKMATWQHPLYIIHTQSAGMDRSREKIWKLMISTFRDLTLSLTCELSSAFDFDSIHNVIDYLSIFSVHSFSERNALWAQVNFIYARLSEIFPL